MTRPAASVHVFHHATSYASDAVDVPDDPGDIFDELVADPSLCCQQCYRRLRYKWRFPFKAGHDHGELLSYVDEKLPPGAEWEYLDKQFIATHQLRDRLKQVHPPDDDPGQMCRHCGACNPHRSPSTRSQTEALHVAANIAASLSEWGIAHNPLALLVEVRDLKRDPDLAGDDRAVFATATDRAVRAGRGP